MQNIDWTATTARAKKMDDDALTFAIKDCLEASEALDGCDPKGKDSGYYMDEASIYRREQLSRRPKPVRVFIATQTHYSDGCYTLGAYKTRQKAWDAIEEYKSECGNEEEYEWDVDTTTLE